MQNHAFRAQLDILNQKYRLKENLIQIGQEDWKVYSIANYEDLLEELVNRDEDDIYLKDERIPYWAELWPSSIALARYIHDDHSISKESKVLEIGCGLGLSGLSASKKGANVLFTDYLPEPFELVKLNSLQLTGLIPQCKTMDWRSINLEESYDFVLAADIAYEERAFEALIKAFHYFIQQGSTILLSEPNRSMAKEFIQTLRSEGFSIFQEDLEILFQQSKTLVSIYKLKK